MAHITLDECVKFHGHLCSGLTAGYLLGLYAMELIGAQPGEALFCRAEAKNCMIDGIQCVTGCTTGKGNLVINDIGKFAVTLVKSGTGKGVRVIADISSVPGETKPEIAKNLMNMDFKTLCKYTEVQIDVPAKKMSPSVVCDICGEKFSENAARVQGGKICCPDCADK